MSAGATLRVTPVDLVGVAGQVGALADTMQAGSARLRVTTAAVGPPDPAADPTVLVDARATYAALTEASELLASLLTDLGRSLDRQAAALAAAGHGYRYVEASIERQVTATFPLAERAHE